VDALQPLDLHSKGNQRGGDLPGVEKIKMDVKKKGLRGRRKKNKREKNKTGGTGVAGA
jgi:hypothetical protein